jgi:hypothetical protein
MSVYINMANRDISHPPCNQPAGQRGCQEQQWMSWGGNGPPLQSPSVLESGDPPWQWKIQRKTWHKQLRKVSYKCTFGAPDQGQTLDVWGRHLADVNTEVAVTPGVTTSPRKDTLNITKYLSRNLCQSMRSHKLDLRMDPVQLTSCMLTLVQNVWSFLGVNIDTLTPHMGSCTSEELWQEGDTIYCITY